MREKKWNTGVSDLRVREKKVEIYMGRFLNEVKHEEGKKKKEEKRNIREEKKWRTGFQI